MAKRISSLLLFMLSFALIAALTPSDVQYFRYPGILTNPGFENGGARWTNSGSGTFTIDTSTNLAIGINSAAWDAAANNDTLTSEQVTLPRGYYGQACRAEFLQKGGDSTITAKVIDGTLATVASQTLAAKTTFTTIELDFTCPTSGTIAFQLLASGNAAPVYIDQVYIGLKGSSGGSGDGLNNLITNGGAETTAVPTAWSTYNDGASATPVDGTGGTASQITAIARTTTASEIVFGSGSWKFSKSAANAQGQGWAYDFQLAPKSQLYNSLVDLRFDFYVTANYASGDIRAYLYDKDLATVITPAFVSCGGGSTPDLSKSTTACHAQLAWLSTASDDYRLVIHVATTNATAYDLFVDNLYIGEHITAVGATVGEWQNFTPVFTNLPTSSTTGRWRRIGDTAEVQLRGVASGAATGTIRVDIPPNLTIDTTKIVESSFNNVLGDVTGNDATGNVWTGNVGYNSTTSVVFYSNNSASVWNATAPFTWATSDVLDANFRAPIAEWAGSPASFGENNVEYAYNTSTSSSDDLTSFAYGQGGGLIPSITATASTAVVEKRVRFLTPFQNGEYPIVLVQKGGTGPFIPSSETYDYMRVVQNTGSAVRYYGISTQNISSTDVSVYFGLAGAKSLGTTYGAVGSNYPVNANDRYVVVKGKAGRPVGFGIADATNPGLVTREAATTSAPSWTGAATTSASTFTWSRVGGNVTVRWTRNTGLTCSNSTFSTAAAEIPSGYRPGGDVYIALAQVQDNGSAVAPGRLTFGSNGSMNIAKSTGANFTAAANCGWYEGSASYPVN